MDYQQQMFKNVFSQVLASPSTNVFWMIVVVALGMFICSKGLQNGVERITKVMMIGLLGLIVVLDNSWCFIRWWYGRY